MQATMTIQRLVFSCASHVMPAVVVGEVAVRQVDPARDADAIVAVTSPRVVPGGFRPRARGLLADLESRRGRVVTGWLATVAGEVVGFVSLVSAGDQAAERHSIAWLFVSDRARRRGAGRALVAAAVEEARHRGAREIWAETRADWPAAIAFWSAVGFRPVG